MRGASRTTPATTIFYVVDSRGWIQHSRLESLRWHQARFRFRLLTTRRFALLWRCGLLRRRPIYFATWRIVHGLLKRSPRLFRGDDFRYFMAAVTSHSNIGGGLDPQNPIPGRTVEEAYRLAVDLLGRFRYVTVNSRILHELLAPGLENLLSCPNGVDASFFTPPPQLTFDPRLIRIGWVGKERGPKNFAAIEKACNILQERGGFRAELLRVPKEFKRAPLNRDEMRRFYHGIDFYLCASWNEGTPNPALEAGACGLPVVTTRVGNMRELIEPGVNGFFIEPAVESIVDCFLSLRALRREDYAALRQAMRARILQDWSWQVRIENFVDAFSRLTAP
ncbi:MAG: glycosyltransferase [Candidatus Tectomicrobia bacterium]|nr:glycosyltransferase [Candidatus Tectomicrobia bacterium]